jgi:putative lipoprotein
LFACALLTSGAAAQSEPAVEAPEPWWGTDKALHFGSCVGLSVLGYGLGIWAFDDRLAAASLGTGLAVGLGATKEALDAAGLGDPSWKDFTWDVVGAVLGVGLSLTFDAALRGPEKP